MRPRKNKRGNRQITYKSVRLRLALQTNDKPSELLPTFFRRDPKGDGRSPRRAWVAAYKMVHHHAASSPSPAPAGIPFPSIALSGITARFLAT